MLLFNDIFAFIQVDGQELPQYGIETLQDQNTVTCWVASEPDKHFTLEYGHTRPNDTFGVDVFTDGFRQTAWTCDSSKTGRTRRMQGVSTSPTSWRPYMFSKLQLTDEDEYLGKESNHMGEIRLDFYRAVVYERKSQGTKNYNVETRGKVHERAKKALSHCVGLGDEILKKPSKSSTRRTKRLDSCPFASFIFRYREHDILLANGIIPQPLDNSLFRTKEEPKPTLQLKEERKPALPVIQDNLVENEIDDVKFLDAAIQALQKQRTALLSSASPSGRVRASSGSLPPAKRVKRESNIGTRHEVIDLT